MSTGIEVWADISDQFSFLDEHLVYVDAPLEGLLRSSKSGELFAFRCAPILPELIWHWILLPVASAEVAVESAFDAALVTPPERWLSIIEDRRGEEPRLYAASLPGSAYRVSRGTVEE